MKERVDYIISRGGICVEVQPMPDVRLDVRLQDACVGENVRGNRVRAVDDTGALSTTERKVVLA
jgi:hypothetical protein